MRVATFNVRHCARPGRWAQLATTARAVGGLDADLLALQELDVGMRRSFLRDQPRRLADVNGHQLVFAPTVERDGGRYGIALTSRWPLTDVETVELPRKGRREPRAAILATCHPPDVPPMTVVATHLQNGRGPGLADRGAMNQLAWLLGVVNRRVAAAGRSVGPVTVLAGDLNTDRAGSLLGPAGFEWAPSTPTFPASEPRRHIDWIAVRGATIERWEVPEVPVSDHRPLVIEVTPEVL